jgi:Sulfotransferase family
MTANIKARAFLIGCPRSGTTLLQSILFAHPEIFSFPETHFFKLLFAVDERLTQRRPVEGVRRRLWAFACRPLTRLGFVNGWTAAKAWHNMRFLPNFDPGALGRSATLRYHIDAFVKLIDDASRNAGCPIWVEKTPDHLFCAARIRQYVPGALFIHLIRNGPDTVASLVDAGKKYPRNWGRDSPLLIELAVRRWNVAMQENEKYRGDPGHYFVKYEELIMEPAETLRGLCDFLGCAFTENMLRIQPETLGKLIRDDEPWKNENKGPIRNTLNSKFTEIFSPKWQEYIHCQLDKY